MRCTPPASPVFLLTNLATCPKSLSVLEEECNRPNDLHAVLACLLWGHLLLGCLSLLISHLNALTQEGVLKGYEHVESRG